MRIFTEQPRMLFRRRGADERRRRLVEDAVFNRTISDVGKMRTFVMVRNAEARHMQVLAGQPGCTSVQVVCEAGMAAELHCSMYERLLATRQRPDIATVLRYLQPGHAAAAPAGLPAHCAPPRSALPRGLRRHRRQPASHRVSGAGRALHCGLQPAAWSCRAARHRLCSHGGRGWLFWGWWRSRLRDAHSSPH